MVSAFSFGTGKKSISLHFIYFSLLIIGSDQIKQKAFVPGPGAYNPIKK